MKNLFTGITVIILIAIVIHYILLIMKIPSNINKIARLEEINEEMKNILDEINRKIK